MPKTPESGDSSAPFSIQDFYAGRMTGTLEESARKRPKPPRVYGVRCACAKCEGGIKSDE